MPEQSSMPDTELLRIMDAVAASAMESSDEEVFEDVHSAGRNAEEEAAAVREVIARALVKHGRHARQQAAAEYREKVEELSNRQYKLPFSRAERLDLLAEAIKSTPDLGGLTMAYRDYSDMSDEDLESLLEKLAELGLIPDVGTATDS